MEAVFNFVTQNIIRNPSILLGLVAATGLMILKKPIGDVIKGALLAAFGMVILDFGVGVLVGAIAPINTAFSNIVGGVVTDGLNDVTFTAQYGADVGMAMFLGLMIHLLIARFTPIKTIFLTGHMIWWFPFIFVAAGVEGGLSGVALIIFGAICSALYWSIMPWVLRKYVWKTTGDESFTIGHPTGMLSLISGFVASKFGNTEKSTEDLNLPSGLSFLREISITGGIVIFIMFIVVGLIIPELTPEGSNLFMYAVENGLSFGAGLLIMLQGVRMLINQIVPAFQGISEKLVPDALPAFDCPIIFNYKPNAVILGFVVAMITSTAALVIANSMNLFGVMLIPLVITSFFEVGTAAVIGEGTGGLRGSIIGTVVASIVMVAFMGISVMVYQNTISNWLLIFGGNDFSFFGSIVRWIASLFGGIL
ncbi:PTS ascorbate transporter subunit IIC [Erysipelothrix larvae]|uniref:Ascorbate-specific PTS system EIIC component n=1 Tax=Erysipelothrix larvae TaxID=1514105 RepID=A0A120JTU3_9FIRM|nr:PTS ascorbate transporter subunit IIC [Erysipelothrix larvae]AMC93961.1 PTS ascorbate transporter subunit IIC [Erysipelothrix larvae]